MKTTINICGFLWDGRVRKKIRNIQVHIRIKNDNIYIEEDLTEESIVLAFHDPQTRQLTGFGIA